MSDLSALFAGLMQHHVATPEHPLPTGPGVQWIWAQNGIYKRGVNDVMELIIEARAMPPFVPGLVPLMPSVRWLIRSQRLPGAWLSALLADAQRAAVETNGVAISVERQYFVILDGHTLRLIPAAEQAATVSQVRYTMPEQPVLLDIHSHHRMPAFFSPTDNRDDLGLSISAVIGRVFDTPEIICRLNVYGHRQEIPATMLFDHLGPFRDCRRERNAPHAEY